MLTIPVRRHFAGIDPWHESCTAVQRRIAHTTRMIVLLLT